MAGNRRAYEAAMKRAANLAWDRKWSRAIDEYKKALGEFPEDVTALTGLGLAYAETKQLSQALELYTKAAELSPDSPEVIQRVGNLYERLAQWPEAAGAYASAAYAHSRLHDTSQAIELWQKAVVLDPGHLSTHRGLAQAYQAQGQLRKAARHHLIMARIHHRNGRPEEAKGACQTALELDPQSVEAQGVLQALIAGRELPDGATARLQLDADGKRTLDSFVIFDEIEAKTSTPLSDADRTSPAELVRARSLAQMAEAAFAEDNRAEEMQTNLLLAQGADYQARGLADKALDAYLRAMNLGADALAMHFNLGLMYQEKHEYAKALDHLNRTVSNPDYVLGAEFAIGECYWSWSKPGEAIRHLLEALRIIDSQTVPSDRIHDLDAIYAEFGHKYASQTDSNGTAYVARALTSFLGSKGWDQRVIETRQQLDSLAGGSILIALAEVFTDPEAEAGINAIHRIHEYLEKKMAFTALEECFWAIQRAPYYLPLHLRLGDILAEQGRVEEAVRKFCTIGDTYQARGETPRAVAVYRKALELAPMDVEARARLIRILIDAHRIDEAIDQYIVMADAFYQLAQVNRAIETYSDALRYAAQGDPSRHWETNILHRIGDIYIQRVDWRQAIKAYQRIKRVDREDAKARSQLVDLYFKTGQRDQALRELDELIEFHTTRRQLHELLSVLQDTVRSRPDELTLHMRLAKLYLDLKMKQEAITELDTIGEMQLNAGKTQEAIRTIQAIIRLGPQQEQGYLQLLAQLQNQ
jgi:tetratricopeptide (TPR) repeat protein